MQAWSLQGILYTHLNNYTLIHANVGRKTNIPNMARFYSDNSGLGYNAPSSNLSPESAINYELGVSFDYESTSIGATGFTMT